MSKLLACNPARRSMRLSEWPSGDRELWQAALQPGGLRAQYAARSNKLVEHGYGRWLAWLSYSGRLGGSQPPADRIRQEVVFAYVEALATYNRALTQLTQLEGLYRTAKVMGPTHDWSWLRRLISVVRGQHAEPRAGIPWPPSAAALRALGHALMDNAARQGTSRQQAILFRDGLLVALLAAVPMRRHAVAALRVGQQVYRRDGAWWLSVAGARPKGAPPVETPWPADLLPPLDLYLSVHRPCLAQSAPGALGPDADALWITTDGSPMSVMAVYDRVVTRTRSALGRNASTQLFLCRADRPAPPPGSP